MTAWGMRWLPLEPEDVGKIVRIMAVSEAETCGRVAAWSVDSHRDRITVLFKHATQAEVWDTRDIKRVFVYGGRSPSIHTNPGYLADNVTVQTVTNQHPTTIGEDAARQMRYREGGEV